MTITEQKQVLQGVLPPFLLIRPLNVLFCECVLIHVIGRIFFLQNDDGKKLYEDT